MTKRQYRDLEDLTYQERVVLAALEHSLDDDAVKYDLSLGRNSVTLRQIVDVDGRGRVVSDDVRVTRNRMYGPQDVISDLEKLIYMPRTCNYGGGQDFGG